MSAMLWPLLCLSIIYFCSKSEALSNAHYLIGLLLTINYYLFFLKLLIPFLTLVTRPAWACQVV